MGVLQCALSGQCKVFYNSHIDYNINDYPNSSFGLLPKSTGFLWVESQFNCIDGTVEGIDISPKDI